MFHRLSFKREHSMSCNKDVVLTKKVLDALGSIAKDGNIDVSQDAINGDVFPTLDKMFSTSIFSDLNESLNKRLSTFDKSMLSYLMSNMKDNVSFKSFFTEDSYNLLLLADKTDEELSKEPVNEFSRKILSTLRSSSLLLTPRDTSDTERRKSRLSFISLIRKINHESEWIRQHNSERTTILEDGSMLKTSLQPVTLSNDPIEMMDLKKMDNYNISIKADKQSTEIFGTMSLFDKSIGDFVKKDFRRTISIGDECVGYQVAWYTPNKVQSQWTLKKITDKSVVLQSPEKSKESITMPLYDFVALNSETVEEWNKRLE